MLLCSITASDAAHWPRAIGTRVPKRDDRCLRSATSVACPGFPRPTAAMHQLPSSSLLHSRSARIELARQRYFEDGQAPTGVVSEAVFESWARCLRLHGTPQASATFEPVSASRAQLAMTKNRQIHQAWLDEACRLETTLRTTSCSAMLTDATGIVIAACCIGRSHERLMPVATRIGVNLAEDAVGTTAPGVVARTGKPISVFGGEHFFDNVREMHCAAAPIRDIRGHVAAVLDISSECMPFSFDAAAVVGMFASAIENRLLVAQAAEHLVIRFQLSAALLESDLVGLLGIDSRGLLAWANGAARGLLGTAAPADQLIGRSLEEALGLSWQQVESLLSTSAATFALPNGLQVFGRAQMRAPDGRRGLIGTAAGALPLRSAPVDCAGSASIVPDLPFVGTPSPMKTRLRDADLELIQRTLQACGGTVSHAAKRLGVSRGLIYRRLRESQGMS